MHLDICESIWLKLGMIIDTSKLYFFFFFFFFTSLIDFELDSGSRECKKATVSVAIISQGFQSVWMGFGVLFRFVDVNPALILSHPFNIQGRKPYSVILWFCFFLTLD